MNKKPFIGQKDRRISISRKTILENTVGEKKESIQLISDAWAYVEDLSGGEDVEGKVRALYNRAYTVRWDGDVLAAKRLVILDETRLFEVVHVVEIGRKDHIRLVCNLYE